MGGIEPPDLLLQALHRLLALRILPWREAAARDRPVQAEGAGEAARGDGEQGHRPGSLRSVVSCGHSRAQVRIIAITPAGLCSFPRRRHYREVPLATLTDTDFFFACFLPLLGEATTYPFPALS